MDITTLHHLNEWLRRAEILRREEATTGEVRELSESRGCRFGEHALVSKNRAVVSLGAGKAGDVRHYPLANDGGFGIVGGHGNGRVEALLEAYKNVGKSARARTVMKDAIPGVN